MSNAESPSGNDGPETVQINLRVLARGWKQIAASKHELRTGEAELVSREEVRAMMDDSDGT